MAKHAAEGQSTNGGHSPRHAKQEAAGRPATSTKGATRQGGASAIQALAEGKW